MKKYLLVMALMLCMAFAWGVAAQEYGHDFSLPENGKWTINAWYSHRSYELKPEMEALAKASYDAELGFQTVDGQLYLLWGGEADTCPVPMPEGLTPDDQGVYTVPVNAWPLAGGSGEMEMDFAGHLVEVYIDDFADWGVDTGLLLWLKDYKEHGLYMLTFAAESSASLLDADSNWSFCAWKSDNKTLNYQSDLRIQDGDIYFLNQLEWEGTPLFPMEDAPYAYANYDMYSYLKGEVIAETPDGLEVRFGGVDATLTLVPEYGCLRMVIPSLEETGLHYVDYEYNDDAPDLRLAAKRQLDLNVYRYYSPSIITDEDDSRELLAFYDTLGSLYTMNGDIYLANSREKMYGLSFDSPGDYYSLPTDRKGRVTVTEEGIEVVFDEIRTVVSYHHGNEEGKLRKEYPIICPASSAANTAIQKAGPTCPSVRMLITNATDKELFVTFPDSDIPDLTTVRYTATEGDLGDPALYVNNTWVAQADAPKKYQDWTITLDENGLATIHANKKEYPLSRDEEYASFHAFLPTDALEDGNTLLDALTKDAYKVEKVYYYKWMGMEIPDLEVQLTKKGSGYIQVQPIFNEEDGKKRIVHVGYRLTAFIPPEIVTSSCVEEVDELTGSLCYTTANGLTLIRDNVFAYGVGGSPTYQTGKVGSQEVTCYTDYNILLYVGKDGFFFEPEARRSESSEASALPPADQQYDKYVISWDADWFNDASRFDSKEQQKAVAKWEKATLTMNYKKDTYTLSVGSSKAMGKISELRTDGSKVQKMGKVKFGIYWEVNTLGQWWPRMYIDLGEEMGGWYTTFNLIPSSWTKEIPEEFHGTWHVAKVFLQEEKYDDHPFAAYRRYAVERMSPDFSVGEYAFYIKDGGYCQEGLWSSNKLYLRDGFLHKEVYLPGEEGAKLSYTVVYQRVSDSQ